MKDLVLAWFLLDAILVCTVKPVREERIEFLKSLDRKNRI